ncbi:MAG: TIGR00725 family protein [Pseudomonadota bacterium]
MTTFIKISRSPSDDILIDGNALDVRQWVTKPDSQTGDALSASQAFEHLRASTSLRHLVVGVIGPRNANEAQLAAAERIGALLGRLGITLICGGKNGVMNAVSRGCDGSGGLMVGILPGNSPADANEFVGIPLPTGLGEARNMVIAKSARVLIAIGGSYGTLSEVAYGLHFSKPVIGVEGAADIPGVIHVGDAEEAVAVALDALLFSAAYPGPSGGCNIAYRGRA